VPSTRGNFLGNLGPTDKSIAVLPFTNLSPDPGQDYFSDGMMEEILDRLFKIGDLKGVFYWRKLTADDIAYAMKYFDLALEMDPFNALYHSLYAAVLNYHCRYEEAITEAQKAYEERDGNLPYIGRPIHKILHSNHRFQ